MGRIESSTGLKPAYSFDQLVIGPNNHVAAAACREVVKAPGEQYNPLFVFGPAGVGKTHLAQAVGNEMVSKDPSIKVKYISAERFMNEIVTAVAEDRVVDVRRSYSSLDLLILDDIQFLTESKIAQEELFHIFNNMHQENRQVILAADRQPNQLVNLNSGIKSRLEWGLSTDIKVPDEPTRLEILRKKQSTQGLEIPDEMLGLVARALKSNVRELEGFLKRMHAYVNLSHQTISLDLVQTVIKELSPQGGSEPEPSAPFIPPNESPAPAIDPAAIPNEMNRILKPENGHTNGNGKYPEKKPSFTPTNAPAQPATPTGGTFDQLLEAIDMGAVETPRSAPPAPSKASAPAKAKSAPSAAGAAPAPAPVPVAAPSVDIPDVPVEADFDDPLQAGHKEVGAVFFFPEGRTEALETVHRKFQEVIKKHKLKFRLKRVHNEPYSFKGKINYTNFVNVCKANKVPVAIVIGPPPDTFIPEQDFYDLLTVTLDVQGVSLQLVNWGEIHKDYRYLNLALDIALVRSR